MIEPKRDNNLDSLVPYVRDRVERIVHRLEQEGQHPRVFETKRSVKRQRWLYGKGRTRWQCIRAGISPSYAQPWERQVTWTLDSLHIKRKATDIIHARDGWRNRAFFDALKAAAEAEGMHQLPNDRAHIEWRG